MRYSLVFVLLILLSCESKEEATPVTTKEKAGEGSLSTLFMARTAQETGLNFMNSVEETNLENYKSYFFIYNGAGVAVGDINNDGLTDIYYAGNSADDQLFLNKGDLRFEDISEASGIDAYKGWSTGVNMVDINADGWLDIYVCRAGPSPNISERTNRLFINQHDGTFKEEAATYGIQSTDYSAQTAFFDYDLDGDLDMYLLNHPAKLIDSNLEDHMNEVRQGIATTDVFYENVNGKYLNKSREANLLNFGYRHGIAVGDVNDDGYPDLYISSDSDDPDYFCINNGNKTFTNEIQSSFRHTSFNSMGNEMVDINNDGLLDVFVLDMAPSDHFRSKAYMASMNVDRYSKLVKFGYHHQYMFNTYQLNNGNNTFSEIAQYSGIAKTDWSWAPLFFDMDHDGFRDLFVTNGIKENFLYRDINTDAREKHGKGFALELEDLLEIVPSDISENVFYKNVDGVHFEDRSGSWAAPSLNNANGVATADFDNDGDLDFVVNTMESSAVLYESLAADADYHTNWIKVQLEGEGKNTRAIGAKVEVITPAQKQRQDLHTARGYLSCVDTPMVFGLGESTKANVQITWPDGTQSRLDQLKSNEVYTFKQKSSALTKSKESNSTTLMSRDSNRGLSFTHSEDQFDDYYEQILLPHSQSNVGPSITKGDVNNDGLEDLFIGGAAGQSGALYIQDTQGGFTIKPGDWTAHKDGEDTGTLFFDFDNDKDLDLYVVGGGAHLPSGHVFYQDRIYENDGKGNFKMRLDVLPAFKLSGQAIAASDVDMDGDTDLFIGGRLIPNRYPEAPKSYLLLNQNGRFVLQELPIDQLVSSSIFTDFDDDGDDDLMVVGEWSKIEVFENTMGQFTKMSLPSLEPTKGLWFGIEETDIDADGDMDYFVGNLGLNSKFKADKTHEFHIYGADFDDSGTYDIVLSSSYKGNLVPSRGRECSSQQMPFIKEKYTDFKSFASATLEDVYGDKLQGALHHKADLLYSVMLLNNGKGDFTIQKLPWNAQLAPVTDFEFIDLDGDNQKEVIAVGNLYNVEVETERYDASVGAVFSYSNGAFMPLDQKNTGFYTSGDARSITSVKTNNDVLIVVTNNNGPLDVFTLRK